ncbi:MAG: pilus assembly protein PilM [Lachnospiraceae bacterium]|nr:pilus assembly protein PilM [Lachnospiraceae bacterium]MDE6253734.1 pilus assembly protein PilM [Lachnospiraceae bacterium]
MASKTKLTIEIGSEFIKICDSEITRKNVVSVHHAVSIQTPDGAVEDGMVRDINAVADTIRTALSDEMITSDSVTFVLSSSRVAAKEVIIPSVKRDKIQGLVNANASSYFPVNINDYVLSYTVLEEKNTKEEKKLRLLVYAAPEMMVESYYNLAKVLGKKVVAVDYSGNSTLQLVRLQTDAKPNLVVQIGMDTTILSVMNNNVLQLQRTIPYGESALLNEVMSSKNVNAKVALELLSSARLIKDNLDFDEITSSLKQLVNNVNRVIEYYSGRNKETPLQKIVIIGEGADVLGIDTLFTNETNLPTERLTLLKNVESYNRIKVPDTMLRQYMTNIGATIAPVNFAPKVLTVSTKEKKENTNAYLGACVGMVAVAVIITAIPFVQNRMLVSEKDKLDTDIKKYIEIEDIKADRDSAEEKYGAMNSFYKLTENNTEWVNEFLKVVEEEVPSNMTFTSMNIADGRATFMGNCITKAEIAQFEAAIKKKDNIISNLVSIINENSDSGVSFTMSCDILKDSNVEKQEEETTTAEEAE